MDQPPGGNSAALAYADGNLYFRYQDGTMALIEANPKAYKLNGKFKIKTNNGASWPHPVIAGGKLYLRDQDDLLCYDIKAKWQRAWLESEFREGEAAAEPSAR